MSHFIHCISPIILMFVVSCSASVDKDKSGDITRVTAENASLVQQQATAKARVEFCYSLSMEQQGEACQSDTTKAEKNACFRRMFKDCLKGT